MRKPIRPTKPTKPKKTIEIENKSELHFDESLLDILDRIDIKFEDLNPDALVFTTSESHDYYSGHTEIIVNTHYTPSEIPNTKYSKQLKSYKTQLKAYDIKIKKYNKDFPVWEQEFKEKELADKEKSVRKLKRELGK